MHCKGQRRQQILCPSPTGSTAVRSPCHREPAYRCADPVLAEFSVNNQQQLPATCVGHLGHLAQISLQMALVLTEITREITRENCPAELQQSAKPWKIIRNCLVFFFKRLVFFFFNIVLYLPVLGRGCGTRNIHQGMRNL